MSLKNTTSTVEAVQNKVSVNLPLSTINSASITNLLDYNALDAKLKLSANLRILKTAIQTLDSELDKVITQVDINTASIQSTNQALVAADISRINAAIAAIASLNTQMDTLRTVYNNISTFINVNMSNSTLTGVIKDKIDATKIKDLSDVNVEYMKDSQGNVLPGSMLTYNGGEWVAGDIDGGTF